MDIHGRTRRGNIEAHTEAVANMEEQHNMTTTTAAELRRDTEELEDAADGHTTEDSCSPSASASFVDDATDS